MRFRGKDRDDFDLKLENVHYQLAMHNFDRSVLLRSFLFMLADQALVFFRTDIQPSFDLSTYLLDDLFHYTGNNTTTQNGRFG